MRRYRGYISDNARWDRISTRPDDVIITTPSKCGTTWMQTIVGMLIFDRVDLGRPMGLVSPWVDMLTRPIDEIVAVLDAQTHRRFVKTHTPLDGLPASDTITFLAVVRHPLDAALSNRDHRRNMDRERMMALRDTASPDNTDLSDPAGNEDEPDDDAAFLRWWIDGDAKPTGTGLTSLAEFCHEARTYWAARHRPNVHLFHYADLRADRDREMRLVASALGIPIDEERWPVFVAAAGIDAMRGPASDLAPDAHLDLWHSDPSFFRAGRSGAWRDLASDADEVHFEQRLRELAGPDAAAWIVGGRQALA